MQVAEGLLESLAVYAGERDRCAPTPSRPFRPRCQQPAVLAGAKNMAGHTITSTTAV